MENIKESLFLAILEMQAKTMAKMVKIERYIETDIIKKNEGSTLVLDQFKKIEELEISDFEKFRKEIFDRAEKVSGELRRNEKTVQEI